MAADDGRSAAQPSDGRKRIDPVRAVDDEALALARKLADEARIAGLAFMDEATGGPSISRIMIARAGASLITLVSSLAAHAGGLALDRRCALLLGEPGKGDPLAHPRISVIAQAARMPSDAKSDPALAGPFLELHPKAQLYFGFGDFHFWRFDIVRADLNGGFGKAYRLDARDWAKAMA
jgi:heme iron utilization protein